MTKLESLLEWARWYTSNRAASKHQRVLLPEEAARLILEIHENHAAHLRAELVALTVQWRVLQGTNSPLTHQQRHDAHERLIAAVDALAIAEADERKEQMNG